MSDYQLTVGLEVHVELKTKTKMFCGCANNPFEAKSNTNVCPVCYGLPGALPLLNKEAVSLTIKLGQALKGKIATETFWARKNYFYPDLPKGYQISQSTAPLVEQAVLEISGVKHEIERIHLEEDAGKSIHQSGQDYSLVNFNRAGVPLMELVTAPDFHQAVDVKTFCQELQRVMRSLDISDADMEKGQMRCEANISVSKTKELGTKVEVKNINSFKAVEKAVHYEFERQTEQLEKGDKIAAETRTWDAEVSQTILMRSKETSADYRYFPEPDLPLVKIEVAAAAVHQLPDERRQAIVALGAPAAIATALVDKNLDQMMLQIDARSPKLAKEAAHLMLESAPFSVLPIEDKIELLEAKQKNGWTKDTLAVTIKAVAGGQAVDEAIKSNTESLDLKPIIDEVAKANQSAVVDYKAGKENALHFLVGQVMAKTQGKANINDVRTELLAVLRQS